MIRILVRVLSPTVRDDLERTIATEPDFQLVHGPFERLTGDPDGRTQPDIIVSEVDAEDQMPVSEGPEGNAALVLLTDNAPPPWALQALEGGAGAVLPRDFLPEELLAALRAVAAGFVVIHPDLASLASPGTRVSSRFLTPVQALTPREREVLERIAEGLSNREIAERLSISEHTAKFHIASILSKLGAASRTEAVTVAIRRGLLLL